MIRTATVAVVAAGLALTALAGGAVVRMTREPAVSAPDAVLARGYRSALADSDVSWSTTPANVWLSGLDLPATAFGRSLGVGDRIAIAGPGGTPQTIEVTAIEQVDGQPIGLAGVKLQVVTGRADGHGPEVRFLFAREAGAAATRAPASTRTEPGRSL
jgi:hypothetical protein